MQIRPFELADIPPVIQLRRKCFGSSSQTTQQLAEARFRKVLFENPWFREDIPSLVAVNDEGAIIGFLGVVPRPMTYRGEPVLMAVKTQIMADPDAGEMAGVALLQSFFSGPQDISLGDLANDDSSRICCALGARLAGLHCLYWTRPLRLAQFASKKLRLRGFPKSIFRVIGAMAAPYLQRQRNNPFHIAKPDCDSRDIDAERLCALYGMFLRRYEIQAVYTEADLDWLLRDIAEQLPIDTTLRVKEIADSSGRPLGWYLYCFQKGGAAEILQIGGRENAIEMVIASAIYHAYLDGAAYITGRVQPEYLSQLSHPSIHFSRRGPWVTVGSRCDEISGAILEGKAWLTRLEGEWWMNF